MRWVLVVAFVLLGGAPAGGSSDDPDTFFNLAPGTTATLEPALQASLKAAAEDFTAVLSGQRPTHATRDDSASLPADGGTSYWVGPGYRLTISKSLVTIAGVTGYAYGPVLELGPELAVGNTRSLSEIKFYPSDKIESLLAR